MLSLYRENRAVPSCLPAMLHCFLTWILRFAAQIVTRNHMLNISTAEQLIASSRPRVALLRGPMFILLGLSVLLGALSADSKILPLTGPLAWILPQAVLLAVGVLLVWSAYRQRAFARQMQDSFEAVQLGQWQRALNSLSRLLQKPMRHPIARAESLLALAALAEAHDKFEAAQRIYECLLEERQADPLQLHTARVGLGSTWLRTGQIRDAVGLIDRLEREDLPGPLRAQVELLALFRELTMGHAAERADRAEERRNLFRQYLGTRAGYGYGLLSLLFERIGNHERAGDAWYDATMLVSPAELCRKFPELNAISAKYPAVTIPSGLSAPSRITRAELAEFTQSDAGETR